MIVCRFLAALLMLVVFVIPSTQVTASDELRTAIVARSSLAMFSTEGAAQAHCPSDVVVWLNTKTGIWHEKGMRWYGRTRQGAYVCRKEAAAAGYRDTMNGQ